ncbi:MAG: hypothetical protein IPJ82_07010 [Lewinellaceae bacterium]|nr:hypothetical protein [Lewinellaceae bacterium]
MKNHRDLKNIDEQAWDKQLDAGAFKRLFKTNPFRHAGAILLNWGLVFAGIFAAEYFQSPFFYVGAVIQSAPECGLAFGPDTGF